MRQRIWKNRHSHQSLLSQRQTKYFQILFLYEEHTNFSFFFVFYGKSHFVVFWFFWCSDFINRWRKNYAPANEQIISFFLLNRKFLLFSKTKNFIQILFLYGIIEKEHANFSSFFVLWEKPFCSFLILLMWRFHKPVNEKLCISKRTNN